MKIKKLYYKLIKKSPASMPMVNWWKTQDSVDAKLTKDKRGQTVMIVEGEKYPVKCFPRGAILFGSMSKLKHEIKNQVFNDSWHKLEFGLDNDQIIEDIKETLFGSIARLAEGEKYNMMPPEKMSIPVREIHRAWTKVSPETSQLRDYLCYILQEDDSYLMRVQWLVTWFGMFAKIYPLKAFKKALAMLEHGEVIGDMKERQRLLKRILELVLEDESIKRKFIRLFREINWKKIRLTEGDKYNFRAKFFKCDLDLFDY